MHRRALSSRTHCLLEGLYGRLVVAEQCHWSCRIPPVGNLFCYMLRDPRLIPRVSNGHCRDVLLPRIDHHQHGVASLLLLHSRQVPVVHYDSRHSSFIFRFLMFACPMLMPHAPSPYAVPAPAPKWDMCRLMCLDLCFRRVFRARRWPRLPPLVIGLTPLFMCSFFIS